MEDICINIIIERAKRELRLGLPILFDCQIKKYLVLAVELLTEQMLSLYSEIGYEIIIPSIRAKLLYNMTTKRGLRIRPNSSYSADEIANLSTSNVDLPLSTKIHEGEENDKWIIQFVKSAELLPCAMIAEANDAKVVGWCERNNITSISITDILKQKSSLKINEICRTPLILKEAENAEIIVYRDYSKDHYAIIIGDPFAQDDPIVRIHSSCYTGDLLDSLTCDCGGQLKSAIKFMSENGGGIILYLSQEGRGIGLTNKLRTYSEQILNNRDTVDANRSLGFEDDERDFTIAAIMLKNLNLTKVRLITNNSNKISQLEENGITVISHITSKTQYNKYNMHYLHTKFNKLGHMINY